ncbi:MAG: hypothetical protein ABIJ59_09485 [Pseudomonadota bacterium]
MKKNKALFIMVILILFSGCAALDKEPTIKKYYGLTIKLPFAGQIISGQNLPDKNLSGIGDALLVKELLIASTFDSHAFIYRMGENTYQTDFYNEFIVYPAKLITEKLTENIYSSTYFSQPMANREQAIQYRLSGKILNLYGDFQTPDSPKAVMEIRLILEKKQDNAFASYSNKTYRFEEPIASPSPEDLVAGWNKGLTNIILQFLTDYQSFN